MSNYLNKKNIKKNVFFQNLHFAHPYFLLLLLALPFLFFVIKKMKLQQGFRVTTLPAHDRVFKKNIKTVLKKNLSYLSLFTFALLCLAMARPQIQISNEKNKTQGIDIVLAIDISNSMQAMDLKPNRLEAAKKISQQFVAQRPNDQIGLVTFSGESFTNCPLTTDTKVLQLLISDIQMGVLENGTAIGMGLASAINGLRNSKTKSKVIILLTDGENNTGEIDPPTAAELAKQYNIKIYTIGIGADPNTLNNSNDIWAAIIPPSEIDEPLLTQISELTGGRYFRATDNRSLSQIYTQIDLLEKTIIETNTTVRYAEKFYWFALPALILLILEAVLRYTWLRGIY